MMESAKSAVLHERLLIWLGILRNGGSMVYSMAEQWFMEKNLNISMTQINACVHWKVCLTERDSDRVGSRQMCWMEHTGKD